MPAIAAILEHPEAVAALRRSLPRKDVRVVRCRQLKALRALLARRVLEAAVVAPAVGPEAVAAFREAFPEITIVLYGKLRPDDGDTVLRWRRAGVSAVALQGVDDPVVGEIVRRVSLTARRREALAAGPRLLRLSERLQRDLWNLLVQEAGEPLKTDDLARRFRMSREHLSRQFGAGGAPNLKRVVDLLRVVAAAQLLANPGYTPGEVARLLHFSSASHLSRTTQRVAGATAADLRGLTPGEILARFARGKTRSRL